MKNQKWFRSALNSDGPVKMYIYGEIVSNGANKWGDDVCPREITEALEAAGGRDIELHINSPGGDCFGGIAIYNVLKSYSGRVTGVIDGLAASIASVIAMACDELIMPGNACLMVHHAWTLAAGNAAELLETAALLEQIDGLMMQAYQSRFADGVDVDTMTGLLDKESWLSAGEAAGYFGNVQISADIKAVACVGAGECLGKIGAKLPSGLPEGDLSESRARDDEWERLKLELELI